VVVQAQELDLGTLRVYRVPFSTNVERVALAAGHKGLEIEWVDVDPDDRSPVEAVSGQPLVPVLVHRDEVVSDSPKILEWLEARVPEPPLYPREQARRAEATVFVQWFNLVWKRPPNELVVETDDARRDRLAARMRASVDLFEQLLDGRDYLLGEFGVADVVAFPFLKYAAFGLPDGDDELFHRILVDHLPLRVDSPLRAWAERVDARRRA
jgi:glutathione S-transferase